MNENNNVDTHTQGDAIEIDYQRIEDSFYNALSMCVNVIIFIHLYLPLIKCKENYFANK